MAKKHKRQSLAFASGPVTEGASLLRPHQIIQKKLAVALAVMEPDKELLPQLEHCLVVRVRPDNCNSQVSGSIAWTSVLLKTYCEECACFLA